MIIIKSNSIILLAAAALLLSGAVFAVAVRAARESNETIETPAELPEEPAYAQMLFDTSYVHSLDIAMPEEDWDTFLDTCTDKEYWACDLIIDGELYPNAAVRAKGNSSMRMIDETLETGRALLEPCIERDPNSLCTGNEFQEGVDTLKLFCSLRAQSIAGQLDGTIPSTTEGQRADSSSLINTSGLSSSGEASGESGGASSEPSGEADSTSGEAS